MKQPVLDETELDRWIRRLAPGFPIKPARGGESMPLAAATRRFQLAYVYLALNKHPRGDGRWNVMATAQALGVARSYLYVMIQELPTPPRPKKPKAKAKAKVKKR